MSKSWVGKVCGLAAGWLLLAGALAAAAQTPSPEPPKEEPSVQPITVVLARHAEKAAEPKDDPPLSAAGERRAGRLADLLEKSGVTALYATDTRRTQQTLAPLAARLGLTVTVVSAKDTAAMAQAILGHPGGTVVVAGHSNTLGPILEALGAPAIEPIGDGDYDNLYVATIFAPGKATVLRLELAAGH